MAHFIKLVESTSTDAQAILINVDSIKAIRPPSSNSGGKTQITFVDGKELRITESFDEIAIILNVSPPSDSSRT